MRGDPAAFQLVTANSLNEVLAMLAHDPGRWTPLAGGTELMVAHAAGRLQTYNLVSLGNLDELAFIRESESSITIGAGTTFGQLRRNTAVNLEFPLLARAATWIGAVANQNRATIGGNIVNGSPAADAPPALLVYDAEIELASKSGSRRLPYADFHLGYKTNAMRPDELVLAMHLARRFRVHPQYLRKVGARRAMAITKVALAARAVIDTDLKVTEIRLAAASVADRPIRLTATEAVIAGRKIDQQVRADARRALLSEVRPIDDIRSTSEYRRSVAANLLDEFLHQLQTPGDTGATR